MSNYIERERDLEPPYSCAEYLEENDIFAFKLIRFRIHLKKHIKRIFGFMRISYENKLAQLVYKNNS